MDSLILLLVIKTTVKNRAWRFLWRSGQKVIDSSLFPCDGAKQIRYID